MSQITVENIKRSTETASRSTRGVAAAWVNFNGTGTVAVRDSENVSSITDTGTGTYIISFANSFAAADYSNNFTGFLGAGAAATSGWFIGEFGASGTVLYRVASSTRVITTGSNLALIDCLSLNGAVTGDLA